MTKQFKVPFFEKFEVPITVFLGTFNGTDRNVYSHPCHTPQEESGGPRNSLREGETMLYQRLKTEIR